MLIADRWKDYKVIDTSSGEKLEDFGGYLLIRPDPQVIWKTERRAHGWKKPNAHYHRSQKGGGSWEFFDLPKQWQISYELPKETRAASETCREYSLRENLVMDAGKETVLPVMSALHSGAEQSISGLDKIKSGELAGTDKTKAHEGSLHRIVFNLKPFSFKHTGVFPEQAVNWDRCSLLIRKRIERTGRAPKVLNLFAYTGGATLAAAASGAALTHVDSSKGMVTWAKENAAASGLSEAPIRYLVDDCTKFVERELRRGHTYDAIIMDPPSYGRGPKGEIWKIEDDIFDFVKLCERLLSDEALFFLINSYTTGLQAGVLSYMLSSVVASRHKGRVESDEIGLPVMENGLILPCGAAGLWVGEA